MRFLTAEWFQRAQRAAQSVILPSLGACRLRGRTDGVVWHLVIEDGRVVAWDLGDRDDAEIELRLPDGDAWRIARCELDGNEALRRATIVVPLAGGLCVGLPAPLDLGQRVELNDLPYIPDATLTVHYRYADGPFGDVDYVIHFADGRFAGDGLGPPTTPPDVFVGVGYLAMARARTGLCTLLEALEGGEIDGHVSAVMAFAGFRETPEYRAAEIATGSHALGLATVGELRAQSRFRSQMAELMNETEPAVG